MKEVAVGMIMQNGHVLACQRKETARYPLKWEFPGGKIEAGESPQAALARELHEELGIHAEIGSEVWLQEWVYAESGTHATDDGAFRVRYYLVPNYSGALRNRTFQQVRWVTPAILATMDVLEGNRAAIEKLIEYERHTRAVSQP